MYFVKKKERRKEETLYESTVHSSAFQHRYNLTFLIPTQLTHTRSDIDPATTGTLVVVRTGYRASLLRPTVYTSPRR